MDQCAFEGNVGSSADQSFGSGGGLSQSGGSGSVSNSIFISNTVGDWQLEVVRSSPVRQ